MLVHGENGAGKTSLLSAIELALTGRVQSLERADPAYEKQLLHRSATGGVVRLRTIAATSEQAFEAVLSATGAQCTMALNERSAAFFRERVFLPQSLLGQLLQIYEDAGNDAASPLAQFVGRLLGLDRLDILEAGLKPFADVRNVRKNVDGWLIAENEKTRLDQLLSDQNKIREALGEAASHGLNELVKLCESLQISIAVSEENLVAVTAALSDNSDTNAFAQVTDQQRKLASIYREIEAAQQATGPDASVAPAIADSARLAFSQWETINGSRVSSIRVAVEGLLPDVSLPSAPNELAEMALIRLSTEQKQLFIRITQARNDLVRYATAQDERTVAIHQRSTIDDEIIQLSSSAGNLGSALAELTSFILDETCPVCDRNFSEIGKTSLKDHVHHKIRIFSASAERLLTLGRTRSEIQTTTDRLEREIESIGARLLNEETLAELDRRLAAIEALIIEIEDVTDALRDGARLRAADISARRAVSEAQSRYVVLAAARDTLNEFAISVGASSIEQGESLAAAADRLGSLLAAEALRLEERLSLRRKGADYIASIQSAMLRRHETDSQVSRYSTSLQNVNSALERAQVLRDQSNTLRNTVDKVRSSIIRREFNDRLNRVWRDLFVRLAPGEPFVPAFRIPESSTQKLQPKLITKHRDGGEAGGTPGAMLSAGNLNTAALTLFVALHLSVPKELPWLILDDPVQSMDDVHIAHFSALLRTLSKEHGRQVMVAVHDRQLFEYLKLELSPAYREDSLLTLELSRGSSRNSVCISKRYSFKEETALLEAV